MECFVSEVGSVWWWGSDSTEQGFRVEVFGRTEEKTDYQVTPGGKGITSLEE